MQLYRIGRAPTNDIVVPEQTVSREHAELRELGDGRFSIKDLGSTYGISVLQGEAWTAVTEAELRIETRLRLGEFETSVAELLDVADETLVPANVAATPPPRTAPPAKPAAPPTPAPPRPPAPPRTAAPTEVPPPRPPPPKPPPPRPPRTAAPTEVPAARPQPPRPARTAAPTEVPVGAPQPPRQAPRPTPAPAAPRQPAMQFLRDMPKEKRTMVLLAGGFGVFLLISLIVLVLALTLG